MTTETMMLRPAFIGGYDDNGRRKLMPVSDRELARTEAFVRRVLIGEALDRGRYALLIATLRDAPQMMPFERALIARGLVVCNAEANAWDGARIESIIRRFDVVMVATVNATVLDALSNAGHDPVKLFQGKIVWASGAGYNKLAGTPGIDVRRWATIGPALAIEGKHGGGAHVDGREWHVETDADTTYVSSRLDRAMAFDRLAVPLKAKINRAPCPSGAFGPRIIL